TALQGPRSGPPPKAAHRPLPLPQLHRPVRLIQERLPRLVLRAAEADRDGGVALGLHRATDEAHARLVGGAAALAGVAADAGADEVRPRVVAALDARDHVVERELLRRVLLAAVLAAAAVARVDVPPVELDVLAGEAVEAEQPDDLRHGDHEPGGVHPVV